MNNLDFLKKLADENNIKWNLNKEGDLQIDTSFNEKIKQGLCFHLADLINGEKDAEQRWQKYYEKNIRCVFVYPPYLENPNKVNVYKIYFFIIVELEKLFLLEIQYVKYIEHWIKNSSF